MQEKGQTIAPLLQRALTETDYHVVSYVEESEKSKRRWLTHDAFRG